MKKNKRSKSYTFKDFYSSILEPDLYLELENKVIFNLVMSNPDEMAKNLSQEFDINNQELCKLKKKELFSNYDYLKDIYEIRRKQDINTIYDYFLQFSNMLMVMDQSFVDDTIETEMVVLEMQLFHLLFLLHFESGIHKLLVNNDQFKGMIDILVSVSSEKVLNEDTKKYSDDFNRTFRSLLDCYDMSTLSHIDYGYLRELQENFIILAKRLKRDIFIDESDTNSDDDFILFEEIFKNSVALKDMLKLELRHLIPLDKNNEPDVSNVLIPIGYGALITFKSSPLLFVSQHLLKYIIVASDENVETLDAVKEEYDSIIQRKEALIESLQLTIRQAKIQNKNIVKRCHDIENMNDNKSKGVLEENSTLRHQLQKKDDLISDYHTMKAELIGLRNYVYHLESDEFDKTIKEDFISQLKRLQHKYKIVIFGGSTKWRHNFNEVFTDIQVIDGTKDFNIDQVKNCDMYFIYTKLVKHAAYDKLMSHLGSQKKIGYINFQNIERVSMEIIQQLSRD
jgi:hypothetical protein